MTAQEAAWAMEDPLLQARMLARLIHGAAQNHDGEDKKNLEAIEFAASDLLKALETVQAHWNDLHAALSDQSQKDAA